MGRRDDKTYTVEIAEQQLHDARQSKRLRDAEAENVRLTGQIVSLNQHILNLEQQLTHARARIAELEKPLCVSSDQAAWHEDDIDRTLGRM